MNHLWKKAGIGFAGMIALGTWGPTVVSAEADYPDVSEKMAGYDEIGFLHSHNVIQGYPDGMFKPDREVSRMEAAIMLTRELGLSTENRPDPGFSDMSEDHPNHDIAATLMDEGIFQGTDSNEFKPDRDITRLEMATILQRAYHLENEPVSKEFDDVNGNRKYISEVASNRISIGYPDNTFRPNAPTTRADFSIFMARAIDDSFKPYISGEEEDADFEEVDHEEIRGTYIWHASNVIDEQDKILQFAKENDINLLYTRLDRTQDYTVYNEFVERAHALGIEVHAMGGHPNWALEKGEERLKMFIDYVNGYNKAVPPRQQFDGIHLDIEPYVLKDWSDSSEGVLTTWKDNIELFQNEVKKESDLETSVDLAIWLDDHQIPGQSDMSFSKWVIDTVDHTTLMAFRDTAEGSNGIVDVSEKEMEFADELGKELIVSVEMKQNENVPHISFYEEGKAVMEEELDKTESILSRHDSYHGNAVHAYEYWDGAKE